MMKHFRASLAGLMGLVLVAAIGLAALRNASETWANGMLMLTFGVLTLAVVGAVGSAGARRVWWLGFCLFGFAYMAVSRCWSDSTLPRLPTTVALEMLGPWLGHPMDVPNDFDQSFHDVHFEQIGQCLWTLLAAWLGGILAVLFFGTASGIPARSLPDRDAPGDSTSNRRFLSTMIGLSGIVVLSTFALIATRSIAVLWAGAAFLATGLVVGMAEFGALFGQGNRRIRCLGAAFFGAGYLFLVFGRPLKEFNSSMWLPLPTDQLLLGIRERLPAIPRSMTPASEPILAALEQPVPMRFPNETPLKDLLEHITNSTRTPTFRGIPTYVDPIGLQEAERSLNSVVQINLEGVPLRITLRACLDQLGLVYDVVDGYLRITSPEQRAFDREDPFLIVGHCLIALLLGGFGAMAGPIAAGPRRETAP